MSDPTDKTAKAIRSVALYIASIGEPTCHYQLPDGTIIVIHAAQTLQPGEELSAVPPVAPGCKNPHPHPIYFRPRRLSNQVVVRAFNPEAPRQDCTHDKLGMSNLIPPPPR